MSASYVHSFWAEKSQGFSISRFAHQTTGFLALFVYFFMLIVEMLFKELAKKNRFNDFFSFLP